MKTVKPKADTAPTVEDSPAGKHRRVVSHLGPACAAVLGLLASSSFTFGQVAVGEVDFRGLGDLRDGEFFSRAFAVSADGMVIAGRGTSASGPEAFRWTRAGGMVGLGDMPGGVFESRAFAVSADGSVVVGRATSNRGPEAFRWTSQDGMVGLGDLPGGAFESRATAISADGSVIVGRGTSAAGREAFRWTSHGGMVGLGDLPGGRFESEAKAVSGNGSIVVGEAWTDAGREAFIWTERTGMLNLKDALLRFGLDLTGWTLVSATGISREGSTIVGTGINPAGNEEAWRVRAALVLPD